MTDTQPFMDEARELVASIGEAASSQAAVLTAALTLSSAYQRGREDAAKEFDGNIITEMREQFQIRKKERQAERATAIRTQRDKG